MSSGVPTEPFDLFWMHYPRHSAKKDARKAWQQVNGDAHVEKMLTALQWQTKQPNWLKDDGQFIPMPATWLRGERWEDEPVAVDRLQLAKPQAPQSKRIAGLVAGGQAFLRGES